MIIIFVSNYYNHHQMALCAALDRYCEDFRFISTTVMREERRQLGYAINEPEFVVHGYESEYAEKAKSLIKQADVIIYGGAQGEFSKPSLYRGKTVFYYSERLFRTQPKKWQIPLKSIKYHYRFIYRQNSYLLCSGAYTAGDYSKMRTFIDRYYRWGYFPPQKQYDPKELQKSKDRKKILWCGRLLSLKRPEHAIEVARRLKADGTDFSMDIIGIGEYEDRVRALIKSHGLEDRIKLLGAMKPEQVRLHMEKAGIFLFTSNQQEGWGAVVNEAMNSGCAVVGCDTIGSVPFLITDNVNGFIYHNTDIDELYQKVSYLLTHEEEQDRLGTAAYDTITREWNADIAAQRFLCLAGPAIERQSIEAFDDSGPCSKAPLLFDSYSNGV